LSTYEALAAAGRKTTVPAYDTWLKKKKRRPRAFEDGAGLTEMTLEAGDRIFDAGIG